MQLAEMGAVGNHELAPYRWLDIKQGDTELHSGRCFPGDAAILRGFGGGVTLAVDPSCQYHLLRHNIERKERGSPFRRWNAVWVAAASRPH